MKQDWSSCLDSSQSLTLALAPDGLSESARAELVESELRWHYSCHYFAESEGRDILSHLIEWAPTPRAKGILELQLKDELRHEALYRKIVDTLGLDERAGGYAKAYTGLVKRQSTFSEKVFALQMLTETVAHAYIGWRLESVRHDLLNAVDRSVARDEASHIALAAPLLNLCPLEEVRERLQPHLRKQVLREMNLICGHSLHKDLIDAVVLPRSHRLPAHRPRSNLDKLVARALLGQFRLCDSILERRLALQAQEEPWKTSVSF